MVGTGGPCDQFAAMAPGGDTIEEVSASGGYMLSQCSLPFAAPGHLRGLTLQRTFAKDLELGAPNLFVSSFNEHIGGRQKPAYKSEVRPTLGPLATDGRALAFMHMRAAIARLLTACRLLADRLQPGASLRRAALQRVGRHLRRGVQPRHRADR